VYGICSCDGCVGVEENNSEVVRGKVIVRDPVGIHFGCRLVYNHGRGATLGLGRVAVWRSRVGALGMRQDRVVEGVGGELPM
jgi:hypothetical protein